METIVSSVMIGTKKGGASESTGVKSWQMGSGHGDLGTEIWGHHI